MKNHDEVYGPSKFARDKSEDFARKHPHHHLTFLNRPYVSRRRFFEIAGAGVMGSYFLNNARAAETLSAGVTTRNTAKNTIFIFLTGAISQIDSWDFKTANTPAAAISQLKPETVNGISWANGIFPKIGTQLSDIAIVRSMSAWALVHSLAQTWSVIGRNPVAALGDVAPNIGSIVAIEKEPERKVGQVFPAFVALNTGSGPGAGYFPATYAPFRVNASRNPSNTTGIPNTTNASAANANAFDTMLGRLHTYDDAYRKNSPYGPELQDYDAFYSQARGMMYNSAVQTAFNFTAADSARYGSTQFGTACLIAKQILAANQGTRFIQITQGGWDMHQGIYDANAQSIFGMAPVLDNGLSALLSDLKATGLLNETLVVVVGEFGRTPAISAAAGRDHFLLTSALFAGAGVKGGKVIGQTNSTGSAVSDFGWSGSGTTGPRYARPEDMEATIMDAMGIDWTTKRTDDPYGRGFEYVPFAADGAYGPIRELWS